MGAELLPQGGEGSTLVKVTRNDTSPSTWDFVSDNNGIACLERPKKGKSGPPTLQGQYFVPFNFTVELLP